VQVFWYVLKIITKLFLHLLSAISASQFFRIYCFLQSAVKHLEAAEDHQTAHYDQP
jgi:hypothetical protein